MYLMDKFIAGEIALHVKNDNDALELYKYLHERGYKWTGKDLLLPPKNLPSRNERENTSYSFIGPYEDGNLGLAFTTVDYDVSHGMEVHSYDRVRDYVRTGKLTKENFKKPEVKQEPETKSLLTAIEAAKQADIVNKELDKKQLDIIINGIKFGIEQGFYETVVEKVREGTLKMLVDFKYNVQYDKDIDSYLIRWDEYSGEFNRKTMDNEDIGREPQLQS
jgi:hypothetical protein